MTTGTEKSKELTIIVKLEEGQEQPDEMTIRLVKAEPNFIEPLSTCGCGCAGNAGGGSGSAN
jgi:hypothetical protein